MTDAAALWASLPVPALRLGPDDAILDASPAAELFLNLSARALAGASVWDAVAIDAPIEDAVRRARDQNSSLFVSEVDVGSGERPPLRCDLHVAPLQGSPGEMLMFIAPRELASRMARAAGSARSAIGMADMLAHEIKNPLAGIAGAAQLLADGLSPEGRELTDLIVEETRRVVALLEQVERFGDLRPPAATPVNVHDALDRARAVAAVGFGAHMAFVQDYDPSLPSALADADQLRQVFLNLIRNACEASPGGGTIRLRTFYEPSLRVSRPDGSRARLPLQVEVADDGPGIPPGLLPDLFEPFVSGRENGTGLGLALVAKLVEQNGGWVGVESGPGRTAFRLSLPLAPGDR